MVRHSEELLSRMIPKRIVCFLKPTPCALAWYGTRLLDHAPLCPPSQKKSKFEEFNFSFFIFLLFLFFLLKMNRCANIAPTGTRTITIGKTRPSSWPRITRPTEFTISLFRWGRIFIRKRHWTRSSYCLNVVRTSRFWTPFRTFRSFTGCWDR